MAGVDLKENTAIEYFDPACDVFKAQAEGAVIELFKIGLNDTCTVVMNPEIHFLATYILCKVYEACIAMFKDIVDEFLDNAKYK